MYWYRYQLDHKFIICFAMDINNDYNNSINSTNEY